MGYQRIDFGSGITKLRVSASDSPAGNGDFPVTLEFRIGSPQGRTIARLSMNDAAQKSPEVKTVEVKPISAIHDLYLVNTTAERWHLVRLDHFRFLK